MKPSSLFKVTGLLLILSGLLTGVSFELLRQHFLYPDILRMPASYVLSNYHQGGIWIQLMWYGMSLGSLLFIISCLLLYDCLTFFHSRYVYLLAGLGVLAGLFNTLGFIRWVFLVPVLASGYVNPATSIATKESIILLFESFHLYMGFSLGEHLGFIFLACWGTGLSIFLYPYPHFPKWLIYLGISSSIGTFMGVLEGIGWELAANIVSICSSLLILWIILLGIFLGRLRAVKLDHTGLYRKIGETSFERVS